MVTDHAFFMSLALKEAWKYQGLTYPNPAVGALVLDGNGQILSIEAHRKAGEPHAEVNALKSAFLKLSKDTKLNETLDALNDSVAIHSFLSTHHDNLFSRCTIYVTLEPCAHHGRTPPCSLLIATLGIKKVIIGSLDTNEEAAGGMALLKERGTEVAHGIMEAECDKLLEPFRLWQKGRFVFFKHAQTLNGTIDGGYISSEETLDYVHTLRDRTDLLVIGGNTVRTDRPTLDARRVGGKAPDVLILSRSKEFDTTIPLFGVPGRKVMIRDTLDVMDAYQFVMIEGGGAMFEAVKDRIDWHLILISPQMRPGLAFNGVGKKNLLSVQSLADDILIWSV